MTGVRRAQAPDLREQRDHRIIRKVLKAETAFPPSPAAGDTAPLSPESQRWLPALTLSPRPSAGEKLWRRELTAPGDGGVGGRAEP